MFWGALINTWRADCLFHVRACPHSQRKMEAHNSQEQNIWDSQWSLELPWHPGASPPLWEILLSPFLPGFLVQSLINWNTRLKLSARPHNGVITCVLCVRGLTERLYSTVKQSLGFWQGKKEINMCPGERNMAARGMSLSHSAKTY